MKVQIERLRQALQLLKPAVGRKANMEVLAYVRLGEGKVVAGNMEVFVTVSGVGESAAGDGVLSLSKEAMCLPYGLLVDLLAPVPGYVVADITVEHKLATMVLGSTTATLKALPGTDFPPVPTFTPEHDVAVDGDALVRCLSAVAPYAAKEDARPVLAAVCLTLGEKSEAVGADGFRLAWQPAPKLPGEGALLIPRGAVTVLKHLWKHAPKPPTLDEVADVAHLAIARRLVRLEYSQTPQAKGAPSRGLRVTFGEVSLHIELVQGTFPKYQQLIPDFTPSVVFHSADLLQALRSVAPMARDGSGIARLSWRDDKLQVKARADEVGSSSTSIRATCLRDGEIAFNIGYLLSYLTDKDGFVTLSTEAPSKPGLLSYRGIPDVVVMPMFVQPEGKTQPAAAKAGTAATPQQPGTAQEPKPSEKGAPVVAATGAVTASGPAEGKAPASKPAAAASTKGRPLSRRKKK